MTGVWLPVSQVGFGVSMSLWPYERAKSRGGKGGITMLANMELREHTFRWTKTLPHGVVLKQGDSYPFLEFSFGSECSPRSDAADPPQKNDAR